MVVSVTQVITGLSSMATRVLLAELSDELWRTHELALAFESGGGVAVAQQVREGAAADLLVLAEDAMAKLDAEGHLVPGTLRALFASDVVAAVPMSGCSTDAPGLDTEDDLRTLLVSAERIAYSTGPSGTALVDLISRWSLAEVLDDRLVQAPPGVPVGTLLAEGQAALGFQQFSELKDNPGVRVLGPLPGDARIRSIFSGAVLAHSGQQDAAADALALLAAPEVSPLVVAAGLAPA
jgi:molybdate transport system substrate-binding protein